MVVLDEGLALESQRWHRRVLQAVTCSSQSGYRSPKTIRPPLQRARRLQPRDHALELARGHEGSRCRDHSRSRQGEIPHAKPRIISDNGPQFIAKDFKEFIRISGMTHVRTSPYYPQSNGKLERWHKSLKGECIRPGVPLTPEDARRLIECYVEQYNTVRLHSAIGFVTAADMLAGRQNEIHASRDRKLEQARRQRQLRRRQAA